jgi:hypothetical protein
MISMCGLGRMRIEKLNYMHRNPVKRGLVTKAKLWAWSSYRFYQYGEKSVCTPDRGTKIEVVELRDNTEFT